MSWRFENFSGKKTDLEVFRRFLFFTEVDFLGFKTAFFLVVDFFRAGMVGFLFTLIIIILI